MKLEQGWVCTWTLSNKLRRLIQFGHPVWWGLIRWTSGEHLHWIYWNVLKSPVCQTILNFCYSLHPSTVSPSLRTELLKIYCLSFFPALNARYNLPSLTFLHTCYYSWWSTHWILPSVNTYLLQSHHWSVFTVKSFYWDVSTCGVYRVVTGRATGRHQDIQQQQ